MPLATASSQKKPLNISVTSHPGRLLETLRASDASGKRLGAVHDRGKVLSQTQSLVLALINLEENYIFGLDFNQQFDTICMNASI